MCKWGTYKEVIVTMQPDSGYLKSWIIFWLCIKERFRTIKYISSMCLKQYKEWKKNCKIDSCIADIVDIIEYNNVRMLASCCGHGKENGSILLLDRTEIVIPIEFTSNKGVNRNE